MDQDERELLAGVRGLSRAGAGGSQDDQADQQGKETKRVSLHGVTRLYVEHTF